MTLSKTLLTADDLLRLPDDGQRYELVRGELQTTEPAGGRHGQITANLIYLLNAHVKPNNLGIVTAVEIISPSEKATEVQSKVEGNYSPPPPNPPWQGEGAGG